MRLFSSTDCHDLIPPFILHINLIIPAFFPAVQLLLICCGLCFPGWVPFSSPFGHCVMGIFLKYWASSCNSLACLSLVIVTQVQYCSLGTPEFTASWYCYHLGSLECPPRPPVLSGFSPGELPLLLDSHSWHPDTVPHFQYYLLMYLVIYQPYILHLKYNSLCILLCSDSDPTLANYVISLHFITLTSSLFLFSDFV